MKRNLLYAALLAAALPAAPASAALMLSADINGTLFSCTDQDVLCDTNPLLGQLRIADQTIAGVEIQGSSQFQIIGTTANALNTSSFQFINHNLVAAPITLAISGISFIGPVNTFSASGSGTWQSADGSNLTVTYYGDAANTQGADNPTDLPGLLLATFSDTAVGLADAFAFNSTGPFLAPGPLFSMSLGTTGTLAAWNGQAGTEPTLVGRSQTELAIPVPEPGSMALVGIGMIGLAGRKWASKKA